MQTNNNISDMYTLLLETAKGVKDGTIEIDKAKTIAEVSQVVVNAGKLECEYLKLAQKTDSKFLTDKTESIDETLKEIEQRRKETYKVTPKELTGHS
jgi:hypothetical protein